jgi:AcrR family transcriptional regulator
MNGDSFTKAGPETPPPRRERERRQRRAAILKAAEKVFAAKGFHAASMEEIARAAEFATGTVYLYFKDKEALYIELFEQKIEELSATILSEVASIQDPIEALKALVLARMGYFERNRTFFTIYAREGMNRYENQQDRWRQVTHLYEEYLALLAELVESGQRRGVIRQGDPRLFAVALSGMMIQLTRDWLQNQDDTPLSARAQFVIEMFFTGAEAK